MFPKTEFTWILRRKYVTRMRLNLTEQTQYPAQVPGNYELDMQKAGLIKDPFYGENTFDIQKLENRHLWYCVNFDYAGKDPDRAYPDI